MGGELRPKVPTRPGQRPWPPASKRNGLPVLVAIALGVMVAIYPRSTAEVPPSATVFNGILGNVDGVIPLVVCGSRPSHELGCLRVVRAGLAVVLPRKATIVRASISEPGDLTNLVRLNVTFEWDDGYVNCVRVASTMARDYLDARAELYAGDFKPRCPAVGSFWLD